MTDYIRVMKCEYREEPSEAQRRNGLVGRRCQRRARWKGWATIFEGNTHVQEGERRGGETKVSAIRSLLSPNDMSLGEDR